MRIHNLDEDRKIDNVGIFLTMAEAKVMKDDLERLISKPAFNHAHISTEDFRKEITIAIYKQRKLDEYGFDERTKKLIIEDI